MLSNPGLVIDVIRTGATRAECRSKAPMFGSSLPRHPDRARPA
jgi:hypothetical protein